MEPLIVRYGLRLFRYESWQANIDGTESFLRCTLKRDFDTYKMGDKIQMITIDFFIGKITFSEEQDGSSILLDSFDIEYTFHKARQPDATL
tara:strand:+ start:181 stop:453 length:273 start_codon:yes stop_codon:yes gene_type:complete